MSLSVRALLATVNGVKSSALLPIEGDQIRGQCAEVGSAHKVLVNVEPASNAQRQQRLPKWGEKQKKKKKKPSAFLHQ